MEKLVDANRVEFFDWVLVDSDIYTFLFRLVFNLLCLTVIVRYLYYPKTKRKDYLFTFYLIGIITFFICFSLKKLDIDTGMGLGLFAIFGIIRYRTNTVEIKEMTYLFVVIGLSVINAMASNKITLAEMAIINLSVIGIAAGMEYLWLLKHETRKTIVYERIDLIKPENYDEMLADLKARTGLEINRFEIGKINFLRDVAQVMIYYYEDSQKFSDYSAQDVNTFD